MSKDKDEYTLQELRSALTKFKNFVRKNLYLALVLCGIGIALGVYFAKQSDSRYLAKSTIMLESSKGAGLMGLASQLGLGGTTNVDEDKIMRIIIASEVIKSCLKQKVIIHNKSDFFANHYIEYEGIKEKWIEQNKVKSDFKFKLDNAKDNYFEDSVLNQLSRRITGNISTKDQEGGFVDIITEFKDDQLSLQFNHLLVNSSMYYFTVKSLQKDNIAVSMLEERADSLLQLLQSDEMRLAKHNDASMRIIKTVGLVYDLDMERRIKLNSLLYMEVKKNLELAQFNLLNKSPNIQIIDSAFLPLEVKKFSTLFGVILGFFIGLVLTVIIGFIKGLNYAKV